MVDNSGEVYIISKVNLVITSFNDLIKCFFEMPMTSRRHDDVCHCVVFEQNSLTQKNQR